MLFSVDIDQFYLVYSILSKYFPHESTHVITVNHYGECRYLPRELSNMVQLKAINFTIFSNDVIIYSRSAMATNHRTHNWRNYINLAFAGGVPEAYAKNNEDIVDILINY